MSFVSLKPFVNAKEGKNVSNLPMNNFDDFYNNVTHGCGWLFADANCVYDYNFIFSIALGGFMLYVLLSMGIDIAIRTIKLGILELLAPIPIASYINNQENFKAWYQNAFKVYVDLFIRLIVIYFIVYVMAIVGGAAADSINNNGIDGMIVNFVTDPFVTIYIIIGLLMFAKQAPKFICDILGIKSDGTGIADMFKRAGGFAGATLGGLKTARSNFTTQKERLTSQNKKGAALRAALSAGAGAVSATGRGLLMSGQGKGFNDVRKNAFDKAIAARNARNDRVDNLYNRDVERYIEDSEGKMVKNPDYYGYREYRSDKRRSSFGIPSTPGFKKAVYDVVDQVAQSAGAEKSFGATKMNETPNLFTIKLDDDDILRKTL